MKYLLIIITSIIFSLPTFSQENEPEIKGINIYMISWNTKYRLARTIDNFKEFHLYYFKVDGTDLSNLFDDSADTDKKLSSSKILNEENKRLNAMVELEFKDKIITVFFDNDGNYNYNNKWYHKHDGMYLLMFKYFSDELIPKSILDKSKDNFKSDFWENR